MNIKIDDDDWYALLDKIDMIPNSETAYLLRDRFMSIEAARMRGMWNCSNDQRYLKNAVDSIFSKYKDNANKGGSK